MQTPSTGLPCPFLRPRTRFWNASSTSPDRHVVARHDRRAGQRFRAIRHVLERAGRPAMASSPPVDCERNGSVTQTRPPASAWLPATPQLRSPPTSSCLPSLSPRAHPSIARVPRRRLGGAVERWTIQRCTPHGECGRATPRRQQGFVTTTQPPGRDEGLSAAAHAAPESRLPATAPEHGTGRPSTSQHEIARSPNTRAAECSARTRQKPKTKKRRSHG